MLKAALKEKAVVEEKSLQDYERTIKEENVKSCRRSLGKLGVPEFIGSVQ